MVTSFLIILKSRERSFTDILHNQCLILFKANVITHNDTVMLRLGIEVMSSLIS